MKKMMFGMIMLTAVNAFLCCMLGFQQSEAQQGPTLPFANSVEQRNEMIEQLRDLNASIREQNELLRSGQLQVILADSP